MRQSDAFAPQLEVHREDGHDLGPADPRPYLTAKDRPAPRTTPELPDGPTHRAADVEPPSGEELSEKDSVGKSKLDELREELVENFEDVHDWADSLGKKLDQALDRQVPTGHHVQVRPREPQAYPTLPHGVDAGTTAGAMLATGLLIGEMTRRTYRKAAERREKSNAGVG